MKSSAGTVDVDVVVIPAPDTLTDPALGTLDNIKQVQSLYIPLHPC